ncbi:MAG TPA: helix-turn-helix transcriptional regulator [Sphaerochaeta sp.]|nr:helix-turn-helix transcriptional regulator [Sphaerochaeta sp.]
MRKKAVLLYRNEEDRSFLTSKTEGIPWISCEATPVSRANRTGDCHILISRTEDLPSLLKLKRVLLSYRDIPLLVFSPVSQFSVLRMMESSTCKVVEESIDTQSLCDALKAMMTRTPDQCKEEPPCCLTLRERQVVALILSGEENKEIAAKMGIKLSTVYAHKKNLFLKTGMHTTSQLVVWALLREFAP